MWYRWLRQSRLYLLPIALTVGCDLKTTLWDVKAKTGTYASIIDDLFEVEQKYSPLTLTSSCAGRESERASGDGNGMKGVVAPREAPNVLQFTPNLGLSSARTTAWSVTGRRRCPRYSRRVAGRGGTRGSSLGEDMRNNTNVAWNHCDSI